MIRQFLKDCIGVLAIAVILYCGLFASLIFG